MLAVFWSNIYPLYPFLDREKFDNAYDDLWRPASAELRASDTNPIHFPAWSGVQGYPESLGRGDNIPETRPFHILLNLIFALASHWSCSEPSNMQSQRSELYWKRCKELLQRDFDIFTRPRLQSIQALLYIGVWLQSTTGLTGACSNIVAVAIRMSEALALHCNPQSAAQKGLAQGKEASESLVYCSLRWRVWAGCVMMDQ